MTNEDMLSAADSIAGNAVDAPCVERLISNLGRQSAWAEVLTTLREALLQAHESAFAASCRGAALKAFARASRWQFALGLLGEIRRQDAQLSLLRHNYLLTKLAWEGELLRATEVLQGMHQQGPRPTVASYQALISACAARGWWERALAQLKEMRTSSVEADTVSYSALITACERGRQWTRAVLLFTELEERGHVPDLPCCGALISACEKGRQWERALETLGDMRHRAMLPGLICYNAAMSACAMAEHWQAATSLLNALGHASLTPDLFTHSAAIGACSQGARWECAIGLLAQMRQAHQEPDAVCAGAALHACAQSLRWRESLRLLSSITPESPPELLVDSPAESHAAKARLDAWSPVGILNVAAACEGALRLEHTAGLLVGLHAFAGEAPLTLLSGRSQGLGEPVLVANALVASGALSPAAAAFFGRRTLQPTESALRALRLRSGYRDARRGSPVRLAGDRRLGQLCDLGPHISRDALPGASANGHAFSVTARAALAARLSAANIDAPTPQPAARGLIAWASCLLHRGAPRGGARVAAAAAAWSVLSAGELVGYGGRGFPGRWAIVGGLVAAE